MMKTSVTQRDMFQRLFDYSADGMFLIGENGIVDCNRAAANLMGCTDTEQMLGLMPSEISPEHQSDGQRSIDKEVQIIADARRLGNLRFEWLHRRLDNGEVFPVEVLLTALGSPDDDEIPLLCGVWRDISDRKQAEKELSYRLGLEALITDISSRFINLSTEEIGHGIQQALAALGEFVGADRTYVFGYSADQQRMTNLYEWCAEGIEPQIHRLQNAPIERLAWCNEQILNREIVLYVEGVTPIPETAPDWQEIEAQGVKSLMLIPTERLNQVTGFLGFDAVREPIQWGEETTGLLQITGGMFANILERTHIELQLRQSNLSLERRVRKRTEELERRRQIAESLRDTLTVLNSYRPLSEILEHIVTQATHLMSASACVLYSHQPGADHVDIEATYGWPDELADIRSFPLDSLGGQQYQRIIEGKQNIFRSELRELQPEHDFDIKEERVIQRDMLRKQFLSLLALPLVLRERVYGVLAFYYRNAQDFLEEQVNLATAFTEQAALAIENARLRARVEQAAAATERSRLARDLHDSVTQTLFSASITAEVLPVLWQENPADGLEQLEELRSLTKGALAEMRTLLLELRPQALIQADLADSLRHLVVAAAGRASIPVHLEVTGQGYEPLPPEVKIALYRIAQEALNNVTKHADADRAYVRLGYDNNIIRLTVADDGVGFERDELRSDCLGLGIMRERSHAIGASIVVDSVLGQGTQIVIAWRQNGQKE